MLMGIELRSFGMEAWFSSPLRISLLFLSPKLGVNSQLASTHTMNEIANKFMLEQAIILVFYSYIIACVYYRDSIKDQLK